MHEHESQRCVCVFLRLQHRDERPGLTNKHCNVSPAHCLPSTPPHMQPKTKMQANPLATRVRDPGQGISMMNQGTRPFGWKDRLVLLSLWTEGLGNLSEESLWGVMTSIQEEACVYQVGYSIADRNSSLQDIPNLQPPSSTVQGSQLSSQPLSRKRIHELYTWIESHDYPCNHHKTRTRPRRRPYMT